MKLTSDIEMFAHDAYTISSTQEHELGARARTPDGRTYRYAKAGGTELAVGKITVAATQIANHADIAVAAAAAVGVKEVTVTLGATLASENQYAGGYLVVNDEAGEGIAYPISGHPAAALSTNLVVTIDAEIQVALTTSSEVSLVLHPYSGAVISVTDQADLPTGVPNVTITALYYFWLQTGGVCSTLADEDITAGTTVTIGTSVAGAIEAIDAAGEPRLGFTLQAAVDTEYRAVFLTIED